MNRKGFTLVELLAVIIILSLLALITGTAVTKMVKDSKDDLSDVQNKLLISAAKTFASEDMSMLPENGECSKITLRALKSEGYIDSKIVDPQTKLPYENELTKAVTIRASGTASGRIIYTYDNIENLTSAQTENCVDKYGYRNFWDKHINGDLNGDGVIDATDVALIQQVIAGSLQPSSLNCISGATHCGDINNDTKYNGYDLQALQDLVDYDEENASTISSINLYNADVNYNDESIFISGIDTSIINKYIGSVVIQLYCHPLATLCGDANDDGMITIQDKILLKKYLAYLDSYYE